MCEALTRNIKWEMDGILETPDSQGTCRLTGKPLDKDIKISPPKIPDDTHRDAAGHHPCTVSWEIGAEESQQRSGMAPPKEKELAGTAVKTRTLKPDHVP